MRISGLLRISMCALALAILPLASGCGSNPFNPDPIDNDPGLPPDTPLNDTPQNTMIRFERTYENQVIAEYEKLFASNFFFTFSSQSDNDLVNRYGLTWGKDDEVESTSHLFAGFTNELGEYKAPATQITLTLSGAQFIDDPAKPDSGAFYKYVIVPTISLSLEIPNTSGFEINAPHDFYLVRGDVALLDPSQSATADRWYIWRWDDKSPQLARTPPLSTSSAAGSLSPAAGPTQTTWGGLKATYAGTRP